MPRFPSVEWFEAVRQVFNSEDQYQTAGGGSCDAIVGLKIGDEIYVLVFEGFECSSAREAGEDDLYEADFYLEMTPDEWREMLENIAQNGSADLDHSLNSLDLKQVPRQHRPLPQRRWLPPRLLLPLQPDLPVLLRRFLPHRKPVSRTYKRSSHYPTSRPSQFAPKAIIDYTVPHRDMTVMKKNNRLNR